jgi:hypothetical protein
MQKDYAFHYIKIALMNLDLAYIGYPREDWASKWL